MEKLRKAAIEYADRVRKERYRSTGEWLNPTGHQVAICAFEAGALFERERVDHADR